MQLSEFLQWYREWVFDLLRWIRPENLLLGYVSAALLGYLVGLSLVWHLIFVWIVGACLTVGFKLVLDR